VGVRSLRLGAAIVLVTMAMGATLLALAMHRYPGGTELDPTCAGHQFWFNFLCDLMGERALNGASNAAGRELARAGMAVFAVGLGAFWMILPAEFAGHRVTAAVVRAMGVVSAAGILGVPFAEGPLHAVAVFAAAIPGVLAATVGLVATVRYASNRLLLVAPLGAIATATYDSILYAQRVADNYRSCPPALPVVQRLTLLFVLAWGAVTAVRALRPPNARNPS
jgi:hypothetical protein